jgi:hypothetical protein
MVTPKYLALLLQKDLSALEKWEEEWQMSFHPQKCTVIRIATNQRSGRSLINDKKSKGPRTVP